MDAEKLVEEIKECKIGDLRELLEAIVDTYSLETTVDWLAEVCFNKANHIRDNWSGEDDRTSAELANSWESDGSHLLNYTIQN